MIPGASALLDGVEPLAPSRDQAFSKMDSLQRDVHFQRRIIEGD